ncbi:hypothetical protein [Pseudanabaena sp. 'Roaring Creek']|uniref:hypothetical protein n=1 Tax=Pseudanabaena sp. 'Roaring Creek' TaxID=1681830 RepID=UPI0006D80292|nr:hypothetical protein [Pseudanabaena sp. 'Roaring Creek']
MIDLLANTKSTAFIESAFRLLEIQSIRNLRIPSKPIKTISIEADFNQSIYSIYAELPLTIVPNVDTNAPELEIEDIYTDDAEVVYGDPENIGQLFAQIAFVLEVGEQIIEDGNYIDTPDYYYPPDYFNFPIDDFYRIEYTDEIDWESVETVATSFSPIIDLGDFTEQNPASPIFEEAPTDEGFYIKNPKNIETRIDIEEMKVFVSATIPFSSSTNNQGQIKITPLDYV